MEWTIQSGDESRRVESLEDIATMVRSVIEHKCEFMVLTPPQPVNSCNFMQVAPESDEEIHLEVSIVQDSEKTLVFSQTCTPNVTITLLTLFYTENAVPDTSDWTFVGKYQV